MDSNISYKRSGAYEKISFANGCFSTVTTVAGVWNYSYDQSSGTKLTTTVVDPKNHKRVVTSTIQQSGGTVAPYVETDTVDPDGLSLTVSYGHDGYGRQTSVTSPSRTR